MEKLIELLKEYIENYGNDAKVREEENYILDTGIEFVYGSRVYLYETIISKKFGFIQWLVENDKIDLFSRNPLFIYEDTENGDKQRPYSFYEEMLIRLAISYTPIEDLISYLK